MNEYKYSLEKYTGRSSRYHCPSCGKAQAFTLYIDTDTGQPLNPDVGRCDREDNCGYHYTPKDYFYDHLDEKPDKSNSFKRRETRVMQVEKKEAKINYIPKEYVRDSLGYKSDFVKFLCSLFDGDTLKSPTVIRLVFDYRLAYTKDDDVIYLQIDINNNVRTGKIMKYNPETGHRIKNAFGAVDWIHSRLKRSNKLPDNFNLSQCLFGEHLLPKHPDKIVALVESEKSAIIASGVFPDSVWLATGGRSQLSIEKMKVLKGRTVVMFPDVDINGSTFALWSEKAKELEAIGCNVLISDMLESIATEEEKSKGLDIADYLIRQGRVDIPNEESCCDITLVDSFTDEENILQTVGTINPFIYEAIEMLDLVSASTGEKLKLK